MEQEYFEQLLDARFQNVHDKHIHVMEKLEAILEQTTKTNGNVKEHAKEIRDLREWRATSQGHWRAFTVIASGIGGIIGALAAYFFKS